MKKGKRRRACETPRKIERQEVIKQVRTKSTELVRLSRVKYFENPYTFVDIRAYSRGFDEKDNEVFYPTRRGVQIKEEDFTKLVDSHFIEMLDRQIARDPRG